MSEQHEGQIKGLPENAYTELKPGEEYKPLMPADSNPQEITVYSVTMGLLMAFYFLLLQLIWIKNRAGF